MTVLTARATDRPSGHRLNPAITRERFPAAYARTVRKDLGRLAYSLDPRSLAVLCLGLRTPRLTPSRVGLAHRHEPDLVPDRAHALGALHELERAGLVTWTPARRDELPEPHYLLTRRGRRLARWLVAPSPDAPADQHRAA